MRDTSDTAPLETPWLVRFTGRPTAPIRLICFPHAGGSAMTYYGWARRLPEAMDLVGVQYPGRCSRLQEPGLTDMDALIRGARTAVAQVSDAGRVAYFGHSLGAVVAFEVARALSRDGGRQPDHLFVSARPAPTAPANPLPAPLTDDRLRDFLRHLGGMPEEALGNAAVMAQVLPGLRNDLTALGGWRYEPAARLDIPVTALGGTADPEVPPATLAPWAAETTAAFDARTFAGGHFYLTDQSDAVLDVVLDALEPRGAADAAPSRS